jgi:uncharacterized protein YoaH (UPF0181 family)
MKVNDEDQQKARERAQRIISESLSMDSLVRIPAVELVQLDRAITALVTEARAETWKDAVVAVKKLMADSVYVCGAPCREIIAALEAAAIRAAAERKD